ncbi:nuclear transcription factor Y subunit B-4-like [Punica granatum]|uniref:Transcription factor CBF/NF-Y/archaeal histone domain-containing protein n=2 Tax=Punica granatum TaxID=22663 RepID=A0A218XM12_PUNGR|nr:nuclear transcription factor Y subunit B-4-like [Punica granatum]OWM85352.1 hypothetical protein CDL15_Pgr018976 [Punica granatum]PKI74051.1 hypothetical protein CRG98_005529 [Punica granatum]
MADEQERMLPIANIGRIMKQMLPASAKISKEAKQTVQECATEFISFVTGEASEKCQKENRKTVNGDDICWALSTLGFDDYARAMMRYLQRYREQADKDRSSSSSSVAANRPQTGNDGQITIRRSSEELFLGSNGKTSSNSSHQQEEETDRNAPPTLEFGIINEKNV